MKVLGFDVGIKHLAYCITEYNVDTETYNIPGKCSDNWNIINLTEDYKLRCANPECDASVTQTAIVNGQNHYYCGRHKKLHLSVLEANPISYLNCDKGNCEYAKSCKGKTKYTYDGMCICEKHKIMIDRNLDKERTLKKHKVFVKDFTTHDLKLKLLYALDGYSDIFLNVDVVCIENQPAFKNPTMKAISDVMYTWFLMRANVDNEFTGSTIHKITFFSPSNKMKINDMEEELNEEIDNAPNKYKKTKDLAIVHTRKMLSHDSLCIEHLNSFKKQDDLCDAYLHGVYYLQKEMKLKKNKK